MTDTHCRLTLLIHGCTRSLDLFQIGVKSPLKRMNELREGGILDYISLHPHQSWRSILTASFFPPVKMKHRPVFRTTQQGGFLSDAASNYRHTVNLKKKNLSYSKEGSACLCSHYSFPSDAAALVSNWKAACCSFSNWTAPQTSPAPLPSLVRLASKTRRLCLPHPVTSPGYLSLRRRASGEPHFCCHHQPDWKVAQCSLMNFEK